jgi:hypothetical protein
MRAQLTVFLVLCLSWPARGGQEVARYENKWIVVLGSARDLKEAWRTKAGGDIDAEILLSTHYSKLEPGLFLVVAEGGMSQSQARALSRKLKKKGIENEVKLTGPLFDFAKKKYRIEKIAAPAIELMRSSCFVHQREDSPDGQVSVSIRGQDPTSSVLLVRRGEEEAFVDKLFFQAQEVYWSGDSKRVAFGDDDLYADSGNQGFVIVDLERMSFAKVGTLKLSSEKERGKRDMFELSGICWLPPGDRVMFRLSVNFMGSSGNPGIDEERKDRLGGDFGKSDPVDLGTYVVYLEPSEVDLETMPAGLKVYAEDKFGYIDKTGKMVIKPRYDAAGPFEGGVAVVRIGDQETIIDTKGRPAKPRRKKEVSPPAGPSGEVPAPVKIGDRYGYQDTSGMIVIDPLFDQAGEFKDGLALVKVGGKLGFIDTKGAEVVEPRWDELHSFCEDLALIRSGDKYGYVDRSGQVAIEPRYESAGDFSEGLAPVKIGAGDQR